MSVAELKEAIQYPLQQQYPQANKQFEDALLNRLAHDAAGDATYLPLLQVTLEDLWAKGSLRLSTYSTLTEAIQQRAEDVYMYADYLYQQHPRSATDQMTILQIFLDLVDVSLDNDARRDVRRRRTNAELTQKLPDRARLIEDLISARLLSRGLEMQDEIQVDVVDIIHETLISNWPRLRQAIADQRHILQQRVRFEQVLQQWLIADRADSYLLDGVRLAEAELLDHVGDVGLHRFEAQDLLQRSIIARDTRHHRELMLARQNLRRLAGLGVLLLLALVIAGWFGWLANNRRIYAERQARAARASTLVVYAHNQLEIDPELALLLVTKAVSMTHSYGEPVTIQAEDTLYQAMEHPLLYLSLRGHKDKVIAATYSPDGRFIATVSYDGTVKVWDAMTGKEHITLYGSQEKAGSSVTYSPDGHFIAASFLNTVKVWDARTGKESLSFNVSSDWRVRSANYSPDGRFIITASDDGNGTVTVWEAATGRRYRTLNGDTRGVISARYSLDGRFIISASSDGFARVWNATTGQEIQSIRVPTIEETRSAHTSNGGTEEDTYIISPEDQIAIAAFSPNGRFIVTAGADLVARVWNALVNNDQSVYSQQERLQLIGHTGRIWDASYSPDGHFIVTASHDGTAKVS